MANLRMKELFKALFLAGFLGYLTIAIFGRLWVGFLAFAGLGWLFYDLKHKIAVTRRIFSREYRKEFGAYTTLTRLVICELKDLFWSNNEAKVTTIIVGALVFGIFLLLTVISGGRSHIFLTYSCCVVIGVLASLVVCLLGGEDTAEPLQQLTDKKVLNALMRFVLWIILSIIWYLPKFLICRLPWVTLKVAILIVREVHSRELYAVGIYACVGIFYSALFPPFALPPAQVFPLALGCGVFTGATGLGAHKVLLTASAQSVFKWAEGL